MGIGALSGRFCDNGEAFVCVCLMIYYHITVNLYYINRLSYLVCHNAWLV